MARQLVQSEGDDVLSADNVEALLDQFLEYDGAHKKEKDSASLQSTCIPLEPVNVSLKRIAFSAGRKRQHESSPPPFSASPTKIKCTPASNSMPTSPDIVAGSKSSRTLKRLLSEPSTMPKLSKNSHARVTREEVHLESSRKEDQEKIPGGVEAVGVRDDRETAKVAIVVPRKIPQTKEEDIERKQSRRVVYLGNLPPTVNDVQIFRSFSQFGEIEDISLHSRSVEGMRYAFITFKSKSGADRAVTEGSLPGVSELELCYGGRRLYCGQAYFDHDTDPAFSRKRTCRRGQRRRFSSSSTSVDFDVLLNEYARNEL